MNTHDKVRLKQVSFKYKDHDRYAVANLSFEFSSDGISAIVGESGVGKSTLLKLMAGIYLSGDPAIGELSGEIKLDEFRPEQLRGPQMISWVPQESALLDHLTVADNVELAMTISESNGKRTDTDRLSVHRWASKILYRQSANRVPERSVECERLLRTLRMYDLAKRRPRELSGGERTRVALARALITRPKYLFLDEPFVSLDLTNRWIVYELLAQERRQDNFSTFITTHDIPEAILLADRLIVITRNSRTSAVELNNCRLAICQESLERARDRALETESKIFC